MAVSAVTGVTSTYTPSTVRTSSTTPSSCTTASSSTTATSSTTAISKASASSSTTATSSTTASASTTSTTVNHSSATAKATSSTTVSYGSSASSTAKVSSTTVTSSTTAVSDATVVSSTTAVSSTTPTNNIKLAIITTEDIMKYGKEAEFKDSELYIEQGSELYDWFEKNVLQTIKSFFENVGKNNTNSKEEVIVSGNYSSNYKGVFLITSPVDAIKWSAENIADPIIDAAQDMLSNVDATYSSGINISGTPSIFCFNIQGGFSIDAKGNIALQGAFAGGVTGGTPSSSITVYQSITNAPSINKLEGIGYQIGGSGAFYVYGIPLAVAGDFNIIPDDDEGKTYYGTTTNAGVGVPGAEFHVEWGETATLDESQINIFDIWEKIYAKIMEL